MTTCRRLSARLYSHDSYLYARSLGLCGRCKKRDALAGMAYCEVCREVIQAYNHKRQGVPVRRYESKFTRVGGNRYEL